jgi:hypothetical protein
MWEASRAICTGATSLDAWSITVVESDPIAPLFDLQIHPGANWLTAFATPGSNFRIQSCTKLVISNWVDVASFNNANAIAQWTNTASGNNQIFYRAVSP